LQDQQRAIVVGQRTAGETYVRARLEIPGRDERILLAIGELQRGDGTPLLGARTKTHLPMRSIDATHKKTDKRPGFIEPDHPVAAVARESNGRETPHDPAIKKSIELLRKTNTTPTAS
jgi:hypothetical protein